VKEKIGKGYRETIEGEDKEQSESAQLMGGEGDPLGWRTAANVRLEEVRS